jgi:hypothetical protein
LREETRRKVGSGREGVDCAVVVAVAVVVGGEEVEVDDEEEGGKARTRATATRLGEAIGGSSAVPGSSQTSRDE